MARSLAAGDYTLVMAVESASQPHSFYRILHSLHDGQVSCDCPAWRFSRAAVRSCKHTQPVAPLVRMAGAGTTGAALATAAPPTADLVLVHALQQQWPMITGTWGTQERRMLIGGEPYRVVLVTLLTPNGDFASGAVALAACHGQRATMLQEIAAWTGYAIASEIARRNGYPLQNTPPQHFVLPDRQPATAATPPARRAPRQPAHLGLGDILRDVGDTEQLGDGLTPVQRAENTVQLFLGPLYQTLQQQGFLDVSSRRYPQRVYRLRLDPRRIAERRVRVFEQGRYDRDLCIVRAQSCPVADHFLSVFLGLMTDEEGTLCVVKQYNIFPCNSDGPERETMPAMWRAAA